MFAGVISHLPLRGQFYWWYSKSPYTQQIFISINFLSFLLLDVVNFIKKIFVTYGLNSITITTYHAVFEVFSASRQIVHMIRCRRLWRLSARSPQRGSPPWTWWLHSAASSGNIKLCISPAHNCSCVGGAWWWIVGGVCHLIWHFERTGWLRFHWIKETVIDAVTWHYLVKTDVEYVHHSKKQQHISILSSLSHRYMQSGTFCPYILLNNFCCKSTWRNLKSMLLYIYRFKINKVNSAWSVGGRCLQ